ncbi:MAG: hypothetical protein ABIU63_04165 [Chitinophagaceae bacterium]
MKKILIVTAIAASTFFVTACGDNTGAEPSKSDSTATIIPPPDNSSATNPSLADTNFSRNHDTSAMKKDSLH